MDSVIVVGCDWTNCRNFSHMRRSVEEISNALEVIDEIVEPIRRNNEGIELSTIPIEDLNRMAWVGWLTEQSTNKDILKKLVKEYNARINKAKV